MAFEDPSTANNVPIDSLAAIEGRNGQDYWRERIAASSRQRTMLHHWVPGQRNDPHIHPAAAELFIVVRGRATFHLDGEPQPAETGTVLVVPPGCSHGISVIGEQALEMIVLVAPNAPGDHVDPTRMARGTAASPSASGPDREGLVIASLDAIVAAQPVEPWRVVVADRPELRIVVLGCSPGTAMAPHRHKGDEFFLVHAGRAEFGAADSPGRSVGPGSIMYSPEHECHWIRGVDLERLVLVCVVAPNNLPSDSAGC